MKDSFAHKGIEWMNSDLMVREMINNHDEAEKVLVHTESRYDIYFKVIGKSIFDVFELTLDPSPTLTIKQDLHIPKPMLIELDKDFTILSGQ